MRVRLKGINKVSKRLADGSRVTYYYAWKGGPRLEGAPGSSEFIASYNAASESRFKRQNETVLQWVIDSYVASADFLRLAIKTQSDYKRLIRFIEADFGDFPLGALNDRRTRGEFLAWRDRLAVKSRRQADYAFAVLARCLSWAFDRGMVNVNPCERPGRLYRSTRSETVWTDADESAFLAKAPAHLHLALTLALWTGQRQGDLLRLTWAAYDGTHIRLKQRKTGGRVVIPVGSPLKAALDATKERRAQLPEGKPRPLTILATEVGTSWTESGFRASWRKACAKSGVSGVTFHDLRGTAVTRLALAGCSEAEIATITGHSLRDVGAILDAHYLKRDGGMADNAISKLERFEESKNMDDSTASSFVYVICDSSERPLKIGKSDKPLDRLASLQTANPRRLAIAALFETQNAYELEGKMHRMLADRNMAGEWFDMSVDEFYKFVNVSAAMLPPHRLCRSDLQNYPL